MKKTLLRALVAAGAVFLTSGIAARADETTFCNFYITTLPYTASAQGHYCFDRNLSTAIATGAAITVNSDFVTIDLNNFKLGGGAAGLATETVGIYSLDRSNLTVRGGNIRGFQYGIQVESTLVTTDPLAAKNIVIENNVLDGNTSAGVLVKAQSVTIRNNAVYNTGGTTDATNPLCSTSIAIGTINKCSGGSAAPVGYSSFVEIQNNSVINTFGADGLTESIGIFSNTETATGSISWGNKIIKTTGAGSHAIRGFSLDVCRDNSAVSIANAGSAYSCILVGTNSDN